MFWYFVLGVLIDKEFCYVLKCYFFLIMILSSLIVLWLSLGLEEGFVLLLKGVSIIFGLVFLVVLMVGWCIKFDLVLC